MVGDFFVSLGFVLHVQSCLHIFFPVTSRAVGKKKEVNTHIWSHAAPKWHFKTHTCTHTHKSSNNIARLLLKTVQAISSPAVFFIAADVKSTRSDIGVEEHMLTHHVRSTVEPETRSPPSGDKCFPSVVGKAKTEEACYPRWTKHKRQNSKIRKKPPNWYRMSCRGTHWECICPRETDTHLPGCDLLSTQIKYPSLKS